MRRPERQQLQPAHFISSTLQQSSPALHAMSLLQQVVIGSLQLRNRVVMAPLTRGRSGECRVPNAINAEYYAQRASAGLIVTEAAAISEQGYGWAGAPGIYTEEQQVMTVVACCECSRT